MGMLEYYIQYINIGILESWLFILHEILVHINPKAEADFDAGFLSENVLHTGMQSLY